MAVTPVLLSGGSGTRLWPVSRASYPKQLLPIASDKPMFLETALRFKTGDFAPPLVICNEEHRFAIRAQLAEAGVKPRAIVLEPEGRNTAPAAAVAALILAEEGDSLMLLAPSDHVVGDPSALRAAVQMGLPVAEAGHLVTFGMTPTRAETGYGYIRRGAALASGVFAVAEFVEKPKREVAERYATDKQHSWNSGMFMFRPKALLAEMQAHAPEVLHQAKEALAGARADQEFLRLDAEAFRASPAISIDHAVMEKTKKAAVVPAEMGWSDLGSWSTLWAESERDPDGNVVSGDVVAENARNTLIHGESRLIAAAGIEDLIVVDTPDALLVARRGHDDDIRAIVRKLGEGQRHEAAQPVRVHRPWGWYQSIHQDSGHQVKIIGVYPGQALSLQYHHRRAEHWVVIEGEARVRRGDEVLTLKTNESTFIPLGMKHRLENAGTGPLRIIEVQVGDYLGEDDIVRLEDRYDRVRRARAKG